MAFLRNLTRVLRDEEGVFNQEALALAIGATTLALGGLTLFTTGSVAGALASIPAALLLQLTGLAYRSTALIVAGVGTILVGGAIAAATFFLMVLFLSPEAAWISYPLGGIVGVLAAWPIAQSFRRAILKLNEPGWY